MNSKHSPIKVIFDGECPICKTLVDFSDLNSKSDSVTFIPFQSDEMLDAAPNLTQQQASKSLYVITKFGKRFRGAKAVFEVMSHMSGFFGFLGKILRVPPFYWLAEPFYRLFAHHRHGFGTGVGIKDE
jgi:predicted DCC family thiol-disulfide oxidoreductase YuxK